jgi:hypothetical protein
MRITLDLPEDVYKRYSQYYKPYIVEENNTQIVIEKKVGLLRC